MTYQETLDYLFSQLPMYQRVGEAAYKADLKNTHALMDHLDHPHKRFKTIHVAGTNGKGSVSHMLASILKEAGYKTGLYTSPHLVDFRERIRVNGQVISEKAVVDFVTEHKQTFESIDLSFFEWTVGLAFQQFADQEVDIAIIEVGMGGRLDSTNVITPQLSIITNIGWDHTQFLGDTLEKIAGEKAGIIKEEVPVLIGKTQTETAPVFIERAKALRTPVVFADKQKMVPVLESDLRGKYQAENFQTVLVACAWLGGLGWKITPAAAKAGLGNVKRNSGLRGRWEVLQENPRVICDVGHNREGITHITEQLEKTPHKTLHLVLGFVSDKDVKDILSLFPSTATFYLCQASIPRAMDVEELAALATELDLNSKSFPDVTTAYQAALENAQKEDLVFVGGSTFVVADLLRELDS